MIRDFVQIVRSIYPRLDEELDKQLFNFIRWCHELPDEWAYTKLGDDEVCQGWCRGLLQYLCRSDISNHYEKLSDEPDLIDIYRNMKL